MLKLTTNLIYFCLLFSFSASAEWEGGFFVTQRNHFVLKAEDGTKLGLGSEVFGKRSADIGFSGRTMPYGLELMWSENGYGATGPFVRTRLAPQSIQLRSDTATVDGTDFQLQGGHSWSGPSYGQLSVGFEFGLIARQFFSHQKDRVSNSGMAGGFWGLVLKWQDWFVHTEAALLALSLGSQGKWGTHRDSNALRIRFGRNLGKGLSESSDSGSDSPRWKLWAEFYHLHRTFTDTSYGISDGLFISDVSLSLGVTRRF